MCEIIFIEECYTFTKRSTESALFMFSATHSTLCFSAKIKQGLPYTKSLFYCKTPVVRAIAMFIASQ